MSQESSNSHHTTPHTSDRVPLLRRSAEFNPLFSNRTDLYVFFGPIVAATIFILFALFLYKTHPNETDKDQIHLWFYQVYAGLVVFPHLCATFHKYKIDQRLAEGQPAYQWELRVFLLLLGLASAAFFVYGSLLAIVLTYADIFHHVRQQQGWMALSQKRQPSLTRVESFLDNLMIYNVTLAPLLWWHANPSSFGWMSKNDIIFFLPAWMGAAALGIHWMIATVFLAVYLYWYWQGRPFNLGKLLIILNTWFVFYVSILILEDGFKIIFITFNHTLPYLFLVYQYFKKHQTGPSTGFLRSPWMRFYTPLLAGGLIMVASQYMNSPALRSTTRGIAFLAMGTTVFHFFFDAFIWKVRKRESTMKEFFSFSYPTSPPSQT